MLSSVYPPKEFKKIIKASDLVARTLDYITPYVVEGVSTEYLDDLIGDYIKQLGGRSACLGYEGYPKNACISLNNVICHGIPSKNTILKSGDILNIDITIEYKGFFGDASRMYSIGKISDKARELITTTYDCLMTAVSICGPDVPLSEIGRVIEKIADKHKFGVVRDFVGHGIGKMMHSDPHILHYYDKEYDKIKMQPGMVFTIEPMINTGTYDYKILDDGWTAITADGGLSAQWEHTLGITEDGVMIFTEKQHEAGFGCE